MPNGKLLGQSAMCMVILERMNERKTKRNFANVGGIFHKILLHFVGQALPRGVDMPTSKYNGFIIKHTSWNVLAISFIATVGS